MNLKYPKTITIFLAVTLLPGVLSAQDFTGGIHSLQSVLDQLYYEMLPLCSQLIAVGRGLAGLAAQWEISSRVWSQMANEEPIDVYPCLKPCHDGLCVVRYRVVVALFV